MKTFIAIAVTSANLAGNFTLAEPIRTDFTDIWICTKAEKQQSAQLIALGEWSEEHEALAKTYRMELIARIEAQSLRNNQVLQSLIDHVGRHAHVLSHNRKFDLSDKDE